jgi:hypothetical protein
MTAEAAPFEDRLDIALKIDAYVRRRRQFGFIYRGANAGGAP